MSNSSRVEVVSRCEGEFRVGPDPQSESEESGIGGMSARQDLNEMIDERD